MVPQDIANVSLDASVNDNNQRRITATLLLNTHQMEFLLLLLDYGHTIYLKPTSLNIMMTSLQSFHSSAAQCTVAL